MGRIRMILYRISRLLPYRARKPIVGLSMILGSYIFLEVMISITKSYYLLSARNLIQQMWHRVLALNLEAPVLVLIITCIAYCIWKNFKELQSLLIFLDAVILLFGVLPYLIGV